MKTLDIDVVLKDSFYRDCDSPVLPIPFSEDDINTMVNGGVSMAVIADNLLEMVDRHPEKILAYKPLIINCCLYAGGEAANEGQLELSRNYFLLASDFAPEDIAVRQNLACSYQHLAQYREAIDNFLFVLENSDTNTDGLLETAVCTIECFFANNEKESALRLIKDLVLDIESQGNEAKSSAWATINNILLRDKADDVLRDYFLESKDS